MDIREKIRPQEKRQKEGREGDSASVGREIQKGGGSG